MRVSKLGTKQTSESNEKRALKLRGTVAPKLTCNVCNKTGGIGAMRRWHFDNCKNKENLL